MCQFLETIKILNGRRMNLNGHNLRLNYTRSNYFKSEDLIDLKKLINIPPNYNFGLVKCRVIYDQKVRQISFSNYQFLNPRKFKVIFNDEIDYHYKSVKRAELDQLFMKKGLADDIIVVKKGFITDSYYANLAFRKENQWFTPGNPLLKGTMRQYLIDDKRVIEKNIRISELFDYDEVKIINAMTGWNLHQPVKILKDNIFF